MSTQKTFALLIPLAVSLVFVGALVVVSLAQPPAWKAPLREYQAAMERERQGWVTTLRVIQAASPWAFTERMSFLAYGDSVYYRTTSYAQPTQDFLLEWTGLYTPALTLDGGRPLPFPPEKAWCAWLQLEGAANSPSHTWAVVVAEHADLYNADTVVHELPQGPDGAETTAILAAIGCPFGPPGD